ncbi:hypothetical protein ACFC1B_07435 [Streptomyces xiamenensis]|uniref:hypothetical protein n=1 Tax=Streptomyces xiamenensis TaxID=408015 RepID=UPI0035E0FF14
MAKASTGNLGLQIGGPRGIVDHLQRPFTVTGLGRGVRGGAQHLGESGGLGRV